MFGFKKAKKKQPKTYAEIVAYHKEQEALYNKCRAQMNKYHIDAVHTAHYSKLSMEWRIKLGNGQTEHRVR